MPNDITVLIVEDDADVRQLWAQVIAPIANVLCAGTVREATSMMKMADILLLDWKLGDQMGDVVLDRWVEERGGPCCVATAVLDQPQRYELFLRGVYNALHKPVGPQVLAAIMRHYVRDVQLVRQMAALSVEVRHLRRSLFILALVFVGVAGPQTIDWVKGMVF